MNLLFVYGSLKRGFSNHHFLEGKRFIDEARTGPTYRMYDYGGFPAAVPVAEGGLSLRGELWEIDEPCLQRIDWLEDVDQGLYLRTCTVLAPPHDSHGPVIIYHYLRDTTTLTGVGVEWTRDQDRGGASEFPPA